MARHCAGFFMESPMVQHPPDLTSPITPGPLGRTIQPDDEAVLFAQRHRNNPHGAWAQIASPQARRNANYIVVAQLVDGSWAQVSFAASSGRRPGVVDKTPRKKRGSPKKKSDG